MAKNCLELMATAMEERGEEPSAAFVVRRAPGSTLQVPPAGLSGEASGEPFRSAKPRELLESSRGAPTNAILRNYQRYKRAQHDVDFA